MKGGGLLYMSGKPNRWIRTPALLQVPQRIWYVRYVLLQKVSSHSAQRRIRLKEALLLQLSIDFSCLLCNNKAVLLRFCRNKYTCCAKLYNILKISLLWKN